MLRYGNRCCWTYKILNVSLKGCPGIFTARRKHRLWFLNHFPCNNPSEYFINWCFPAPISFLPFKSLITHFATEGTQWCALLIYSKLVVGQQEEGNKGRARRRTPFLPGARCLRLFEAKVYKQKFILHQTRTFSADDMAFVSLGIC